MTKTHEDGSQSICATCYALGRTCAACCIRGTIELSGPSAFEALEAERDYLKEQLAAERRAFSQMVEARDQIKAERDRERARAERAEAALVAIELRDVPARECVEAP